MYWGITIFINFDVRVGEKRQFFSDSKTMNFDVKWTENVWFSRAFIFSAKVQVLHHFGKLRQNAIRFQQGMGQCLQKLLRACQKEVKEF